jgi:hypothetical protein
MRRFFASWVAGLVVGLGLVSGAAAGLVLGPPRRPGEAPVRPAGAAAASRPTPAGASVRAAALPAPPPGGFLVGAAKVSLAPAPPPGRRWQTKGCQTLDDPAGWKELELRQSTWPQSTDCIYLGGYGIGPVRPATGVSDLGVWTKAVAISDGKTVIVLGKIDAVGYFYRYDNGQCTDCGISDIRAALSKEFARKGLRVPAENIMFASSHSHGAPDFLGGWGGVPDWYLKQARDAMKRAAREAVAGLRPAFLATGDVVIRAYNHERRDFYRSASDNQLVWLRATDASTGATLATIVNYAAHPTVLGPDNLLIHPDWPGGTERKLETDLGGVGMVLESGLGNQSDAAPAGVEGPEAMGEGLAAAAIADMATGTTVPGGQLAASVEEFDQPVTNVPLGALGAVGFFDRAFGGPAAGSWQENRNRPCASASALSVRTTMGAYRIGDMAVAFGPGELFSNLTIAVKDELAPAREVMVVSLANDELGYIIQSFEFDVGAQQALGFVGGIVEYEEAFSLDRCFGDRVVEGLIGHGRALGF